MLLNQPSFSKRIFHQKFRPREDDPAFDPQCAPAAKRARFDPESTLGSRGDIEDDASLNTDEGGSKEKDSASSGSSDGDVGSKAKRFACLIPGCDAAFTRTHSLKVFPLFSSFPLPATAKPSVVTA